MTTTISAKTYVPIKTAGIERVRVDVNGNVGIGTTSPAATLDINGNGSFRGTLDMSLNDIINVSNITSGYNSTKILDISGSMRTTENVEFIKSVSLTPGTTVTRPTGVSGTLRYNSDNDSYEGYTNGEWVDVGYYSGLPLGAIIADASNIVPSSSFLLCDGSAISRTVYSDLFTLIGTTYGSGNGTSTFNLPNLKGKTIVGYDPADASFNALGSTGGEKFVTLTLNQIPSHNHAFSGNIAAQFQGNATTSSTDGYHTHSVTDSGHYHGTQGWITGINGANGNNNNSNGDGWIVSYNQVDATSGDNNSVQIDVNSNGSHSHTFTPSGNVVIQNSLGIVSFGDTIPHNNMQPYITVNFYIKAKSSPSKYNPYISDKRIKKKIENLDSTSSLNVIRNIIPKKYEYIHDDDESKFKVKYGFIAQEIKKELPECVSICTDYIPNINSFAIYNNYLFTILNNINIKKIINNQNCNKIKVFNSDYICFYVTIIEIIDEKTIKIKELLENNKKYFLFGEEINDFHLLNIDSINTILHSGIKGLINNINLLYNASINIQNEITNKLYLK